MPTPCTFTWLLEIVYTLLEAVALPSVFTLGKEPFALGKGFAECSTRQSPLGKNFLGKGSLPSAFYRGTRQNNFFKKSTLPSAPAQALGKVFLFFLKNYFAECPCPGTRQSFFLFFFK